MLEAGLGFPEDLWLRRFAETLLRSLESFEPITLHLRRKQEGLPTLEVMDAYDLAYYTMMVIAVAMEGADSAERVLDEMAEVHARARIA